jgi:hypothetical protein
LPEDSVPQTEYEFTSACEEWALSHDLTIFNDLVLPFQTRPQQPVQQAIQQPVQQAIQQPVQQAIQQPVQQAPSEAAAEQILPKLPELPAPEQRLQIEPPAEESRITTLPTPEPQAIQLPPSPAAHTTEITLPDAPAPIETPQLIAAPISQELELPDQPTEPSNPDLVLGDAPPASPISRELDLGDAPPHATRQVSFNLSDIEQNHWAEPHEQVPTLVKKFEDLLVRNTSPNQWNTEHPRSYPSSTSSLASYPSVFTNRNAAMSAGNAPQRNPSEAGPSDYARRQAQSGPSTAARDQYWANAGEDNPSQFFRPSTHFTTQDGNQYPYTPYAPARPRPTPTQILQAENERLRKAMETEQQRRRDAEARLQQQAADTPAPAPFHGARPAPARYQETRLEGLQQSQYAPSQGQDDPMPAQPMTNQQYQTNLLEQLTQLQIRLANDRLDARPNAGPRGPTNLKPADIGYFEPKAMPDSEAAINFIENFNDAVIHYGEASTLAVLRKCCHNDIARAWVASLKDVDRTGIARSTWHWETVLRRDFMPRPTQLYAAARAELFKWTQGRSPSEYVIHKIRLLKAAGITDDDQVVQEVHDGFAKCPELQIPLEAYVLEAGNDISEYRRVVQRYQESTKMQYEFIRKSNTGPRTATYASRSHERPPAPQATLADSKGQFPSSRPPQKKERTRKRKCRNFPGCGDGEHWDWECKIKAPASGPDAKKRAYYALHDDDDDDDGFELHDEDSDLEQDYVHSQNAHFAAAYCASKGFFGESHKARITRPKPSECRTCHEAFPSRSRLHAHLLSSGHNRASPAKAHFTVIKSKRVATEDHEARLASYHYAEAQFVLQPGSNDSRTSCVDSGYANSAVDADFVTKHVVNPSYQMLTSPKEVHGIGGGIAMCTKLLRLPYYYPTMDGNFVELVRPFHVFPDLGVDLLCGIDTIREEGIDLFFSSTVPQMRIASCQNAAIKINVLAGKQITRAPVRILSTVVVPANATSIVEIKVSRQLPPNQDYLFTPSKLKSVAASGAGAPHAVVSHDQKNIMFTNLHDTDITLFKNTVIGYIQSTGSEDVAVWHEAAQEVRGFLGISRIARACTTALATASATSTAFAATTAEPFDPESSSPMPLPSNSVALGDSPPFPLEPPRPRPCPVASIDILPDSPCAAEQWSPPPWLQEQYVPRYEYELPRGIRVPDVSSTTYAQVIVNETDDISPEQIKALRQLVARHPYLFNDGMGCVREPESEWMRLPVDRAYELKLRPRGPYRLSKRAERAIDENFNDLTKYGRLEQVTIATPWGLQVFVVYKGTKERPVIDMRILNDALAGDSYHLPRMESIIDPLKGMRWLGTVDITSAFYQRLLHPDDRHRAAVVTHRGVEQFATTVMGCKNSVQHQQKLMDKRVLSKLSWRGASCYVDDIVIYAATFQEFLHMTDEVFRVLSDLGITLKARKCFLGFHSIELLGYLVDRLGLTTTESKADAVRNIPFPTTLAQLEHFIGLTNWNRHLVPYYSQRVAPLQLYKTALLKGAPVSGRARKQYAARTLVQPDDTLLGAFQDLKTALADRPRIHHVVDGQPIYAFLDSSREYGTGLAVYQLTGDPNVYSKTRLVPLHFMSRKLSAAEANYWPTDMEMSGLVWAVKKLRPYMEQAYIWFITDHKPNVDIFDMKSLATTSTARSNLRLQTWGIYLSQFWGKMSVLYSKGSKIDCPDALSRLQYEVSSRAKVLQEWAQRLGKEPDMDEFEVTEAFAVTRSAAAAEVQRPIPAPRKRDSEEREAPSAAVATTLATAGDTGRDEPNSIADAEETPAATEPDTLGIAAEQATVGLSIEVSEGHKVLIRQAIRRSKRFSAIYERLKAAPKLMVDGVERHELPETCQYVLHDDLLYLLDPVTGQHRLAVVGTTLQKQHLTAAHSPAHYGRARMADDLRAYYWPKMAQDIQRFLKHCPECLRNKPANHKPFGLLSPIPTPSEPFDTWSIDLVTDLPACTMRNTTIQYDTVMTVTDKFSKAVRFLPGRKDWSAADWANSVYEGVTINGWGYPKAIISDRDKRFLSALWAALLERAGARHITTTAYHPSADGQAERTNFTLEVAMRYFVNESQDDWADKLRVIEALMNNAKSATTGSAPNELIYGKRVRLDLIAALSECTPEADDICTRRELQQEEATRAIAFAQKAMKVVYDRKHEQPNFEEGWAFLKLGDGYTVPGIAKKKLGPQGIGPFRITEALSKGKAYRLELPDHYRIHDVISVAHLEPAPCPRSDPYARAVPVEDATPAYAHSDGEHEWELDALVKTRTLGRGNSQQVQYLGRWKGHGPEWDSWINENDLENAQELLEDFNNKQASNVATAQSRKPGKRKARKSARS